MRIMVFVRMKVGEIDNADCVVSIGGAVSAAGMGNVVKCAGLLPPRPTHSVLAS